MYVHSGTVYNSKDLESTQMPINDRLDKENMACLHHEILCSHIKGWVYVLCAGTWMKLETIILSKLVQEQKTKHCMFSLVGVKQWEHMDSGRGTSHTGACKGLGGLGEG